MGKLERKNHKVFGINATESKVGQFGSANATTKIATKDIEKIQELDAWEQGWEAGAVGDNRYPTQQERTGVDYEHSYQIGYLLQEGIPEWNAQTTYSKGSIVKQLTGDDVVLYQSLIDDNLNNTLSNTVAWKRSFDIGRVTESLITKIDTDLNNLPTSSKQEITSWGFPSNKYIDLTLNASGSTYTAPADGLVHISLRGGANSVNYGLNNITTGYSSYVYNEAQYLVRLFILVKKGDIFSVEYPSLSTTNPYKRLRFFYAVGSEPTA